MQIEGVGAIVAAQGDEVRLEPVLIDDPGPGEVRISVTANGLCHSDHWAIHHGNWGEPFPMLLGHEGAGVIDAVGEGVDGVEPGMPVLLTWAMPCGVCRLCLRGEPRQCAHAWSQPPRLRAARTGAVLVGTLSIGSLCTHTVVHAAQVVPMPPGADPVQACLLGCGVSTGLGAALNTADLAPGMRVAVIGLGGIGLAALQGARISGASQIVAIDLVASKLEVAKEFGATDVVDASAGDAVTAVRALTGGVDAAFEATGVASVVAQAVAMLDRSGIAVAIGVPAPDARVSIAWGGDSIGAAYPNKARLVITDGGDPVREDFEAWLDWGVDGRLDLASMVTQVAPFTEEAIAEGFRTMLAGEVIRTVIRIDAP